MVTGIQMGLWPEGGGKEKMSLLVGEQEMIAGVVNRQRETRVNHG